MARPKPSNNSNSNSSSHKPGASKPVVRTTQPQRQARESVDDGDATEHKTLDAQQVLSGPAVPIVDAETVAMVLPAGTKVAAMQSVVWSGRGIQEIQEFGSAPTLRKIDASNNQLVSVQGIAPCAPNITWLQLSKNQLTATVFGQLETLQHLVVLNLANNNLESIPKHALSGCHSLKALMLNNNKLTELVNLSHLKELNTLVLSHNSITKLKSKHLELPNLCKLSIAHNQLTKIPDMSDTPNLAELRMNHNAITAVPPSLLLNSRLHVIDLGHNQIGSWDDVIPLAGLEKLRNLTLRGNPLSTGGAADSASEGKTVTTPYYQWQLFQRFPDLVVADDSKRPRANTAEWTSLQTSLEAAAKRAGLPAGAPGAKSKRPADEAAPTSKKARAGGDTVASAAKRTRKPLPDEGDISEGEDLEEIVEATAKAKADQIAAAAALVGRSGVVGVEQVGSRQRNRHQIRGKTLERGVDAAKLAETLRTAEVGAGGPSAWDE